MPKKKINVLVFPCGSEIGLEIHSSLQYSTHINLFGASSVDDHGKYVYKNYINNVPTVYDKDFIHEINKIVEQYNIDCIFPAHDDALTRFANAKKKLRCNVLTSNTKTVTICRSKLKTYIYLQSVVRVPEVYSPQQKNIPFPVFLKPEIGQGSKGTHVANNRAELQFYIKQNPTLMILEYLPGKEYTVDCFTDKNGILRFVQGRIRSRIMNGISVNTTSVDDPRFHPLAETLNKYLSFKGVWFFQVKEAKNQDLVLMEIAPRVAGSMGLTRNKGVNLPLLTLFDMLGTEIDFLKKSYPIIMDRALTNRYEISLHYTHVYIDLDDVILSQKKLNWMVIAFLFQCRNNKIPIILITKHAKVLDNTLRRYAIQTIFTSVIHIKKDEEKSDYVKNKSSIFIDDSFSERKKIADKKGVPTFDLTEIESLLDWRK